MRSNYITNIVKQVTIITTFDLKTNILGLSINLFLISMIIAFLMLSLNKPYMIITNIDVVDGLVHGAIGALKLIEFKPNTNEIDKLWILFEEKR